MLSGCQGQGTIAIGAPGNDLRTVTPPLRRSPRGPRARSPWRGAGHRLLDERLRQASPGQLTEEAVDADLAAPFPQMQQRPGSRSRAGGRPHFVQGERHALVYTHPGLERVALERLGFSGLPPLSHPRSGRAAPVRGRTGDELEGRGRPDCVERRGRGSERQSSRTVRSSSRRRAGSASRSISTILPRATVKPATASGRPA